MRVVNYIENKIFLIFMYKMSIGKKISYILLNMIKIITKINFPYSDPFALT